jgi:nitrous oxidase accessory protein NosD
MGGINTFYNNNFIENSQHVYFRGLPRDNTNIWDNNRRGNYWDDYKSQNPDALKKPSGVWSEPYKIDEDNQDNFPLVKPYNMQKSKAAHPLLLNNVLQKLLEKYLHLPIIVSILQKI